MRRINICEERGSGIDKVIGAVEMYQLPPPDFRVSGDNTITVLYAYRKLSDMDQFERIRACYQHACLCYVGSERMTNTSLRKRFAIEVRNYLMASRTISDTVKAELIRIYNPDGAKSQASYVPFWA
jgi:predicted HTH transcriptional regulator